MFGLRVFAGGSLGFIAANRTDPHTIKECIAEAMGQAAAMPADPINDLPERQELAPVDGLFDEATTEVTVAQTTEYAAQLVDQVRSRDQRIQIDSGGVSATTWTSALASSKGVHALERGEVLPFSQESVIAQQLAGAFAVLEAYRSAHVALTGVAERGCIEPL